MIVCGKGRRRPELSVSQGFNTVRFGLDSSRFSGILYGTQTTLSSRH